MISSVIKTICSQPERYDTTLWSYRLSGNQLELTVSPNYTQDPDGYRNGVIQAGQVIQAIDRKATEKGFKVLVQSFPNLEETQLVAIIRIQELSDKRASKEKQTNELKFDNKTVEELLKALASHQGLTLQNHLKNGKDEIQEVLSQLSVQSDDQDCFAVCSRSDNPFIWLKTGYWLERSNQIFK